MDFHLFFKKKRLFPFLDWIGTCLSYPGISAEPVLIDQHESAAKPYVMRWTRATCWDLTVFVGLADRDSSKWFRLNGMLDSYAQMYMYVSHAKSNLHA
jgi:hypothetical protein